MAATQFLHEPRGGDGHGLAPQQHGSHAPPPLLNFDWLQPFEFPFLYPFVIVVARNLGVKLATFSQII